MRENKQSTRVVLWSRIQNFKQQQQSKSSKWDIQHGYAFKVARYSFGKLHVHNLKGRLLLFELVPLRVWQHNEHIRQIKFVIHMHVKKNQPILVRVL